MRIGHFPAYVSFGNWAGIIVTAVGAATIDMYVRSPRVRAIGALLMFPLCFIGVTFTTQLPILVALNSQTGITPIRYAAAIVTMLLRGLPFRFGQVTPSTAAQGAETQQLASRSRSASV